MSRAEFMKNLWRWKCNLAEFCTTDKVPDLDELKSTEFSKEFIELCRNRMVQGRFRYGSLVDGKKKYNYTYIDKFIRDRLDKFMQTGNAEFLCDICNGSMIEFVHRTHPNWYFKTYQREEKGG